MKHSRLSMFLAVTALLLMTGCASKAPPYDYTAFRKAKPSTILVMPPLNEAPEVNATPGVWSHATAPLSEAGYYVLPITLVNTTFRENGVNNAHDAQDIPLAKLREVFGADAALYMKIKSYGTSYKVITSETRVEVEGRLVDLRNGDLLWQGKAVATSAEEQQRSQGGIIGILVTAVVKQIMGTMTDASYKYAGIADYRMLGASRYNGVLPGPRSPNYGKPPVSQ